MTDEVLTERDKLQGEENKCIPFESVGLLFGTFM